MKLSIILPVYNVAEYVERCIRSLENQDIAKSEYELIAVNDGSTDQSVQVIEKLQKEFSNINLVHKKNGGLSSARNYGIKHAKGEYIWFFDSDDYAEPNVLKNLIDKIEQDNLDLLYFNGCDMIGDKVMNMFFIPNEQPTSIITGKSYIENFFIVISAWIFLVKKEILLEHDLWFTEGIIHEDFEFTLRLYRYIQRMSFFPHRVYNYVKRPGSITTIKTQTQTLKSIHSWQTIILLENKNLNDNSDYSMAAQKWINNHKFSGISALFFNILPLDIKKKEFKKFKDIGAFNIKQTKFKRFKQYFICNILQVSWIFYLLMHFFRVTRK